jgi:DNA-directed RNA polymerase subunit K/omega
MNVDPVFKARDIFSNRFLLCVVAFERSKQLIRGARPRAERKHLSHVSTALQEIADGKILRTESSLSFKLG